MRLIAIAIVTLLALPGCESTNSLPSCKVVCTMDSDCPSDQTCGELGLCTAGESCPCTAGEFLGCAGEVARYCNETANGIAETSCEYGCNSDAQACNVCMADGLSCSADGTTLERCSADGQSVTTTACGLGCQAAADTTPAHCGYIEPLYMPEICATPASEPALTYDAAITLDTTADATCSEIVPQADGLDICVIRAPSITFADTVTVRGNRLVAFVADDAVLVQGTIDASAAGLTSGPGGAARISGAGVVGASGAGGAGARFVGGNGGGNGTLGGGGAGGAVVNATSSPIMLAGARGPQPVGAGQLGYPNGGGGGGGVALIACQGDVSVAGTIDVSGGGGSGGRDVDTISVGVTSTVGGAGGGAGGYVVLQGANVLVSGSIFANGGGGGGGCSTDNCVGLAGQDGQRSTSAALGGMGSTTGGSGGNGGTNSAPTGGFPSAQSSGGGGGSSGYLQACAPTGGQITTTGGSKSPIFSPHKVIQIR